VAAELGVAAGIGASFCTPSSDLGFCIGGDLNVIALSLKPTYEHSYYWLLNSKKQVHAIAGFSSFTIPWGVTLLEGAMWAKIALLITEIEWNILEFDGFNVASGNLVEVHDQFRLKL
jgi:hypothetical protein